MSWYGWQHFVSIRVKPLRWLRQMMCRHDWRTDDSAPGPHETGERTIQCSECGRLSLMIDGRRQGFVDWPYGQFFPWEKSPR